MKIKTIHLCLSAGILFNDPLLAGTTESIDEILVTATRSPTREDELSQANTVITREQIDQMQARTLPEILKGSTGIDMVQSGGYGQISSIYMNGTGANEVLVLIDGIRAGSVTSGTTAFELIPADQIERIEIVRGPQSGLYGSEAIGGVIQIFTRKGKQTSDKPNIEIQAGGGSYGTQQESGTISGRHENTWYTLGASNLQSEGFHSVADPNQLYYGPRNPNGNGYRNTAVNAKLGHQFENNGEIEAFFTRSEGTNQFDGGAPAGNDGFINYGAVPNNRKFTNQVVGLSMAMDLMKNWRSSLRLGQTQDNQTNFYISDYASFFDSTRWNASWVNQIQLHDNHKLVLGSDYRLDEATFQTDSTQPNSYRSRNNYGFFAEMHSKILDHHILNATIRMDEYAKYQHVVTGNMGWRYNWINDLSVFANFGNAFRAPTFNDLYYQDAFGVYGPQSNPNLLPETSKTRDIGIAGNHKHIQWQFRGYQTSIQNAIVLDQNWVPQNIGLAQINGLESEMGGNWWGWQNKFTANVLNPWDATHNAPLPGRAGQTFTYDLSRTFGAIDFGARLLEQSGRFDSVNYDKHVGSYLTIDSRIGYHIDKNWILSAKLNNLLDKQYQTNYNYNSFGRNFFITIHYSY